MSFHQQRGGGRPWLKKVLIPFWILQTIFMCIQIGYSAIALWFWQNYYIVTDNNDPPSSFYTNDRDYLNKSGYTVSKGINTTATA